MDNIPGLCCCIHKGHSQRDTFEVGVALLTDASLRADDGVESVYWIERACMPILRCGVRTVQTANS